MKLRPKELTSLGMEQYLTIIMIITTASNITDTALINWNLFLAMASFTEHLHSSHTQISNQFKAGKTPV
jgi:hypothetical protein